MRFLTSIALMLSLLGCASATEVGDAGTSPPPIPLVLRARSAQVKTFELVVIDSLEALSDASYSGSFGGLGVELKRTGSNALTFIVPELSAGTHELVVGDSRTTFVVVETVVPDPQMFAAMLFSRFDSSVSANPPTSPEEAVVHERLRQYKAEAMDAFASLSTQDQRQVAALWTANRSTFGALSDHVASELDAPTMLARKQSDCPRGADYRTYYECTSRSLAGAFAAFRTSLAGIRDAVLLATALGYRVLTLSALSGVALGLAVAGTAVLLVCSAVAIIDTWQAFLTLKSAALAYFGAAWVLTGETLSMAKTNFVNNAADSLGVRDADFRTVSPLDAAKLPGVSSLQAAIAAVASSWGDFQAFFGDLPSWWSSGNKRTALQDMELVVEQISNPDVELVAIQGTTVTFRTISGAAASFTFRLTIRKEGFEESRTVAAQIGAYDLAAQFRQLVPGQWTMRWLPPYTDIDVYELRADGTGRCASTSGVPISPTDPLNQASWSVSTDATGTWFNLIGSHGLRFTYPVSLPLMQMSDIQGKTTIAK